AIVRIGRAAARSAIAAGGAAVALYQTRNVPIVLDPVVEGQARCPLTSGAARRGGAVAARAAHVPLLQNQGAAAGRTAHGIGQGARSARAALGAGDAAAAGTPVHVGGDGKNPRSQIGACGLRRSAAAGTTGLGLAADDTRTDAAIAAKPVRRDCDIVS